MYKTLLHDGTFTPLKFAIGVLVALKSKIWFAIFAIFGVVWLGQILLKAQWLWINRERYHGMFEILKFVFGRALGSLSPKILFAISDFLWVGQNFFMARFAWVRRQQNCDVFVISKLPCGGASGVLSPKFWFAIYDFVWLGQNFLQIDSKMGKTLLHDGLFKTLKFASGGASHFKVENLICDFRYFRRCVAWAKLFYDSMYLVSSWANRWHVRKLEIALWECSRTFKSEILICDLRLYLTWAKLFKGWANLGKTWAKLWRMSF